MSVKSKKYRAKGGGLLNNASRSIDDFTSLAMKKLNFKTNYTSRQIAGMNPSMNQGTPTETPQKPNGTPQKLTGTPQNPTPAQQSELKKIKKQLNKSKKKNKKLEKKNKTLQIENNELTKKLTSVSEDIVKLQDVLPNVNHQIKQMLQDINNYKVYKTDIEKSDKLGVEKPYFEKKNLSNISTKPDYGNTFLTKTNFSKKASNKESKV